MRDWRPLNTFPLATRQWVMDMEGIGRNMSDGRKRNDRGQFVTTVTQGAVVDVLRDAETPVVTAKEVGEALGCSSEAARQKLLALLDEGMVARRKVGAGAVVWWLTGEAAHRTVFHSDDPLFADPPTFASGKSDVSHNVDAYVADVVSNEQDSPDEHDE